MFEGKKDSVVSMWWITEEDGAFCNSFCLEEAKIWFIVNLFCHAAKDWWVWIVYSITRVDIESVTWMEPTNRFREQYVPLL